MVAIKTINRQPKMTLNIRREIPYGFFFLLGDAVLCLWLGVVCLGLRLKKERFFFSFPGLGVS